MTPRPAGRPAPSSVGASAAQASASLVNFGLPAIGPELLDDFDLRLFGLGAVLTARTARRGGRADRGGGRWWTRWVLAAR